MQSEAAEPAILAITATFTAEALEPALSFWVRELGWSDQIRFAPYNQVFQELLDPASLLARNRGGVNIVLVRLEDWARFDGEPSLATLAENVRHFIDSLRSAACSLASPLVLAITPASPAFAADPARVHAMARMEEMLRAGVEGLGSVYLVTPGDIEALYPVRYIHDPHGDELGHIPYTPLYFAALAAMLARRIHALRTAPYKVIVLDCDDTLWGGICGEDGPQGVVVDAPRRALQEFMLERQRSGFLLALASKNNEEDVLETFRAHPEMPLKLEHFVARRINWEPKGSNLTALAEDLELGLDSLILVDDNPKECTEVAASCPDVLALALPADATAIPGFLDHVWAFDRLKVTEEDRRRTLMYAQQAERGRLERQSASLAEFLESLKLEVRIARAAPGQLARIAQLTQRTNQMNVAAVRRSESEIRELLAGGAECLAVEVEDRFGSYGLTGAIIFRACPDALAVDTLLLSCRALGRGVEHKMLAALGEIAASRGLARVVVPYVAAQRNRPALLFLESTGASFRSSCDGRIVFRYPAQVAADTRYRPNGAARPQRPAPAATRAERGAVDYLRIATELRDPARVEELLRPARPAAPAVHADAPRTETERRLVELWRELLNLPSIGIHDNFFDLGGHSLLAVQLLSRVRRDLGVDLSLEVVYGGNFTVAELARAMEMREIEQAGAAEYAALVEEIEGLSDEEVRALLREEEGAAS